MERKKMNRNLFESITNKNLFKLSLGIVLFILSLFLPDKQLEIFAKGILGLNLFVEILKNLLEYWYNNHKNLFWWSFVLIPAEVLGTIIVMGIIGYNEPVKVVVESFRMVLFFVGIMIVYLLIVTIAKNCIKKEKWYKLDYKFFINFLILCTILILIIIAVLLKYLNESDISKYITPVALLYVNYFSDDL